MRTGGGGGIAATRCGADIMVTLEVEAAHFDAASQAFQGVVESWALLLTGGESFACGEP